MRLGRQIAFIDLEACGLGPKSWPIEVGWVFDNWPVRSTLIRPADNWPLEAWEKTAEALHGIALSDVISKGMPVLETALMLNAAFANVDVYSDSPDYDGFWLYRLFEAAGVAANFTLLDFAGLIERMTDRAPADLVAAASQTHPHTHRADSDVRHMVEIYRLARLDQAG